MPVISTRVLFAFALALAIGLAACVPTPAGGGAGEVPSPDGAGPGLPGAPSPVAGPSATPSFVRPTPNPGPTFLVHEVRPGESLISIARLFGTTARSIAYWNRDRYPSLDPDSAAYEPNRIEVGWTLLLIPTEVVNEDELPDPTPSPTPTAGAGTSPP